MPRRKAGGGSQGGSRCGSDADAKAPPAEISAKTHIVMKAMLLYAELVTKGAFRPVEGFEVFLATQVDQCCSTDGERALAYRRPRCDLIVANAKPRQVGRTRDLR
jgi:hypothetical protein